MKPIHALSLALLACLASARAELLVYEPFDYAPHNNETFGRVDGRNGGKGFAAPWKDSEGKSNDGAAYVYDQRGNPEALYGGSWGMGFPDWDGKVNNLPSMGGYAGLTDWSAGETLNMTRKLTRSAGAMAKANGGVLWVSSAWHVADLGYFTTVGIAFTSNDSSYIERATSLTKNGNAIGTGNGQDFRNGMKALNAMVWEKGRDKARTSGISLDPKKDHVVILKFEFGETDTVKAWAFSEDQEISEQAFNANAVACSSTIDEDTLDTLAISICRKQNAVDEIRIATSFKDVISGAIPERQELKITKHLYDKKSDRYFLSWTSNPGEIYGIYESVDAGGYKPCITAAVPADPKAKENSFGPFTNPHPGKADVKFEVGLPDLTPPTIDRVWGNGTTVSLHFTELMHPGPALDPTNYAVTKDGGTKTSVKSVRFHPIHDTVELTTAAPLDHASSFTVTTRNITDRANLPLTKPDISFRTWDDNPNGVKVFILAGQSNMVGRGQYDKGQGDKIGGMGSLREQVEKDPTNYGHLVDADKKWRKPANMKFYWNRGDLGQGPVLIKGDFTVGYGAGPDCVGPEYGFGMELEKFYKGQPVLIIKSAWGGKSLYTDFCSPAAAARRDGRVGPYYIQMMNHVHQLLDNLDKEFPEFAGKGYQIAGFGWHQGWNDLPEPMTSAYEKNMADFIRDIRAEFGHPKLPFSIGTTGHGGAAITLEKRPLLAGQLAVADPNQYPEFAGNVFTSDARPFWRETNLSPKEDGCHWNNNGETLYLIGKTLGEGMVKMLQAR